VLDTKIKIILIISVATTVILIIFLYYSYFITPPEKLSEKADPQKQNKEQQQTDPALEILYKMSLKDKIGQMFMVSFHGTTPNEDIKTMIQQYKVGGVILFKENITDMVQLTHLTRRLQQLNPSGVSLFIAIDEEGGRVSRLPEEVADFPALKELGEKGDPREAYRIGRKMGNLLKKAGINVNFAPVMDVNNNPNNPVIGDRSFGNTPHLVKEMGVNMMKGMLDTGIVSCIKHFPGHGDTTVDSHDSMPVVKHDMEHLKQIEFYPFRGAVEEGADMIMTAHIKFPALDPSGYPATMSKRILTDMLRKEWGFEGVIITDSMTMGAITKNFSLKESLIKSVKAGVDVILLPSETKLQQEGIAIMMDAVRNGIITQKRIDESVYRIIKLKIKYNPYY